MSASENGLPENHGNPNGDPNAAAPKRRPRKQTFSERWRRMSLPNQLMFLATLVIAVATIANVAVFIAESVSSSSQTDKLVRYAKTQANSAGDQADAAQQFSDTAEDINGRIGDAVDQLSAQADAAQRSVKALERQLHIAQASFEPTIGVSIVMGRVTDTNIQYELRIRNEGGSAGQVIVRYCAFSNPQRNPNHSIDECGDKLVPSGPITVLPHASNPIAISIPGKGTDAAQVINARSEKTYLFMPVEIEYSVRGASHKERSCFVYNETFQGMGDCSDLKDKAN